MEERVLVTILMPVYNAQNYLQEAIESILNQSFVDFELLIVNDGSTDSSLDIIKNFNDNRIRIINNKKNIGLIKTLNKGINCAKGKYIARMDADDIAEKDRLKKQIYLLENNRHIGVCGSWLRVLNEGKIYNYPSNHFDIISSLLFYCCLGHPSVVMRHSVLKEHNILYNECFAEDYDLWVRLSRVTQIANIPEELVNYRVHSSKNRLTLKNQMKILESSSDIRKQQLENLGINITDEELKLHESISLKRYKYTEEYKDTVKKWLEKISEFIVLKFGENGIISFNQIKYKILDEINQGINETNKVTRGILESNKKLYIWGTGIKGLEDFKLFEKMGIKPIGFIDNNQGKWGNIIENLPVYSPQKLTENEEDLVLVSSMYKEDIIVQLRKMGIQQNRIFTLIKDTGTYYFTY